MFVVGYLQPIHRGERIPVVLAKDLLGKYFNPEHENQTSADVKISGKTLPYSVVGEFKGSELLDIKI